MPPAPAVLSPEAENHLLSLFGIPALKESQRRLISLACAGRSCLGILPTGFGKSLCYQGAALLLQGTTLVVSPLLALMREQSARLLALGAIARRYDSTLTADEKERTLHELAAGKIQLLFTSPESLLRPELAAAMEPAAKALFVVDEAHCLSAWGHSFRPDYLKLPHWAATHGFGAAMALTATATPAVKEDLCRAFGIAEKDVVACPPRRGNIERIVRQISPEEKNAFLLSFLADPSNLPAIIYCRSRQRAEETAALLQHHSIQARAYHAGQPADVRERIHAGFLSGSIEALAATIAFGMGVDKPDVRSVIHDEPPDCAESYVQESGRAGRDGLPARSLVLHHPSDIRRQRNLIFAREPSEAALLRCLRWLTPSSPRVVSRWEISTECDLPDDVIDRCLDSLVSEGAVDIAAEGFKYYRIKPLFPLATICAGRSAQERARLTWLAGHSDGEVEDPAMEFNLNWRETTEFLRDMEASGEWRLELRQAAVQLRTVRPVELREELKRQLAYYGDQKKQALGRLDAWRGMLHGAACLNEALDAYFGFAPSAPCGTCSHCRAETRESVPWNPPGFSGDWEETARLFSRALPALARPEQRARFLLGIGGPASRRARLSGNPAYGSCADMEWQDVLALAQLLHLPKQN
ncbi:MAG: RecQ family ATP-dependent DNA helicase [Akkermansiaceae bacterium]|nr:RecQ family ATP-dependent DNA helicase [Akkermansiaceae bacterium]